MKPTEPPDTSHWTPETLRRYDAAWARVFAGIDPALIPRFGPSPDRERERLALDHHRTARTLRRLAAFLPRHRAALQGLAAAFARHAAGFGYALPDSAPAPTGMSPAGRLRQLAAELRRREAVCRGLQDQDGADLCRRAAALLERIK